MSRLIPRLVAVAMLSLAAVDAHAQVKPTASVQQGKKNVAKRHLKQAARLPNDENPFTPLARPTHFWIMWPADAMYEGDINIPVHIWSRTQALRQPGRVRTGMHDCLPAWMARSLDRFAAVITRSDSIAEINLPTGCTLSFVPHFTIRQLKGGSAPVQTPSFNPGVDFHRHALILEDIGHAQSRRTREGGSWRTGFLLTQSLRLGHYSNGQSGCLYTNQAPGTCSTVDGPENLNRVDGSFSTNYVEPGFTLARILFDSIGNERRFVSVTGAFRWNPAFLAPIGGMSDELAKNYGRSSVSAGVSFRSRRGARHVTHTSFEGECALRRPDPYRKCRGSASASLTFPALYGLGFAARYVTGWDHYNVGFQDRVRNPAGWLPMIGLVIDHTAPIKIR